VAMSKLCSHGAHHSVALTIHLAGGWRGNTTSTGLPATGPPSADSTTSPPSVPTSDKGAQSSPAGSVSSNDWSMSVFMDDHTISSNLALWFAIYSCIDLSTVRMRGCDHLCRFKASPPSNVDVTISKDFVIEQHVPPLSSGNVSELAQTAEAVGCGGSDDNLG
jgi:hypothetical protein